MGALVGLRWSAPRAGAAGLVACGLVVLLAPRFALTGTAAATALLGGLLTTGVVVYVIFFGLLLYQVMRLGGAIERIAAGLTSLSDDRPALALLLVLGWAPFVESASGFGVGAAVTCPLLLALGFPAGRAALLALLGLCTVPWGALSVGTILGAELTGVDADAVGAICALLSLPLLVYYGLLAAWLSGGPAGLRRLWPLALTLAGALAAGLLVGSRFAGVEVAGVLGALGALGVGVGWLRLSAPRPPTPDRPGAHDVTRDARGGTPSLLRAFAPYSLLTVALLATRLVAPLSAALRSVATLRAPGVSTTLPLLYSPGFWLAAVATVAAALLRLPRSGLALALRLSWRQWLPTALGTVGFVVLGQLMAASGMTAELAAAAARLGNLYAGAVPALGALGGFVTGSNTGANAMLAALQGEAAARLGLSTTFVVALQNTAAANATMATPSRVLLSLAVTGLSGVERRELEPLVTRRILAILLGTLAILALAGLGYAAAR
jgi:lactate permease